MAHSLTHWTCYFFPLSRLALCLQCCLVYILIKKLSFLRQGSLEYGLILPFSLCNGSVCLGLANAWKLFGTK